MMKRVSKTVVLCCLTCLISANTRAQLLRTVVLENDQAPDTSSGVTYRELGIPVLNSAGQTAFRAVITGNGVDFTNDNGIWSEGSGSLALVAREGERAPGTATGVHYSRFNTPQLNAAGQTAFSAFLRGSGVDATNIIGIWSEDSGSLALVARRGDPAPGTPAGVNFGEIGPSFGKFAFNSSGQVSFDGNLTGSGVDSTNEEGIWSGGSGALALIARQGDAAPETTGGVSFDDLTTLSTTVLNSAGRVPFLATLRGNGINASNDEGIWLGGAGSLDLVVRKGDHAPGTSSGIAFSSLSRPAVNSASQVAFSARLAGGEINSMNNAGIWAGSPGSLRLVARKGDQAPGVPSEAAWIQLGSGVINAAGHTAFSGFLLREGEITGANDVGIWSEGFGSLALVARESEKAPGTGAKFHIINGSPVINAAGQTAFSAVLKGREIDSSNDFGIFAQDRAGALQLIARTGSSLEVAPGDFRTIRSLSFADRTGNEDGLHSGFNDHGQLAFFAVFTDDTSGIFVSNLVAVPEPSSLLLVAAAIVTLVAKMIR